MPPTRIEMQSPRVEIRPPQQRASWALPLIMATVLVVLLVNELAYRQIVSTLKYVNGLGNARTAVYECLQLLTDAETAQRGYLLTGREAYLEPYQAARAELPKVLDPALEFLAVSATAATADDLRIMVATLLNHMEITITLVQRGETATAMAVVGSDIGINGMKRLRQAFDVALARSMGLRDKARQDNFDTLQINRWVVASLALFGGVALWLFVRLRASVDQQRAQQHAQLEAEVQTRTADLRDLASHLQTVREDERSHLARELHDEMGGYLSALKLDALRLRKTPEMPAAALDKVQQISQRLDQVIALKRRVIEDLHPSALDMLGLKASLEILCREAAEDLGIPVHTELEDIDLPPAERLTLYRLVQESLTNIRKYARATQVTVRLWRDSRLVRIAVRDDGQGFSLQAVTPGSHGLSGMRYRVESHGGTPQPAVVAFRDQRLCGIVSLMVLVAPPSAARVVPVSVGNCNPT